MRPVPVAGSNSTRSTSVASAARRCSIVAPSAFDEMAKHAEEWGERDHLLRALGENLGRCVACHASYRLPEGRN